LHPPRAREGIWHRVRERDIPAYDRAFLVLVRDRLEKPLAAQIAAEVPDGFCGEPARGGDFRVELIGLHPAAGFPQRLDDGLARLLACCFWPGAGEERVHVGVGVALVDGCDHCFREPRQQPSLEQELSP